METEYVERPPRILPELPIGEEKIPDPPQKNESGGMDMSSLILPLVSMMGFMFASGSGNPLAMAPMALIMLASSGAGIFQWLRGRGEFEEKKRKYIILLKELRQKMEITHNTQRTFYHHNYPDIETIKEIAHLREKSRFGSRLWERRPSDPDFGHVRIGIGTRPSTYVFKAEGAADPLAPNQLSKDAEKLMKDSMTVDDVPITIPLRPNGPTGPAADMAANEKKGLPGQPSSPRHAVGIFGKNTSNTADFARAMMVNIAAYHAPQDIRIHVLGSPAREKAWQWADWTPHFVIQGDEDPNKPRPKEQLCFDNDRAKVQAFWKRIKKDLDQRQVRLRDSGDDSAGGKPDVSLPFYLVVVDMLGDLPENSPLHDVAAEAVVALANSSGPTLGISMIFLSNDSNRIPSECQAMIEVAAAGDKTIFRYTEVGMNSPRYLGTADQITADDARNNFAAAIRRLELQRPFGADLPRSIDMLGMQAVFEGRKIDTVDKLTVKESWERSLIPKNQEWLSSPIGMVSGKEVRNLIFSAKEGGDGVHGMIAGTTGSGKSELLLTLIAGMAIKYDPRIVNFVLVDYKGGAAFEPFKKLPHCVDILTNLQANAVERMFVAIQAVMDQRSVLLAQANAKDLVDYRAKIAPKLPADSPLPRTFPHLFIIVDEFAEMVTQNPDYKAKFESVTRLGRAFGVSLLLATQRPAGVVTDQMRANMKFRICLRVETSDDSKELLGRPDAAFLPNIGGRGYVQVGNDVLQAVQMARAGGDYSDDRKVPLRDVYWLDDEIMPALNVPSDAPAYSGVELGEALGLKPGEKPTTLVDWIVGITALRATRDNVPKQVKPWPEVLPEHLSLTDPVDARYLNSDRVIGPERTVVINPEIDAWLNNVEEKALWPAVDWKNPRPLRADIGLVDNPFNAEQRLLSIDMANGPVALFGGAGRGKTTFIKSLLTAFATQRSPAELNMYALDFGRGGMKAVTALPHLGASIDASETARVGQLMRMLRNFINERQEKLSKYANLNDYNEKNPKQLFAEIVVVIDNFAEFKESYEDMIPDLMALVRDGRQFGIHFVITATTMGDLSGKLYNLISQRFALTMTDPSMVSDVIGVRGRAFDNVPGRGMVGISVKDKPLPMEIQIGMPGQPDAATQADSVDEFQGIAQLMEKVWFAMGGKRPAAELPRALTLLDMYTLLDAKPVTQLKDLDIAEKWKRSMETKNQEWLRAPIGLISSKDIRTLVFQAQADGVHGMGAGTTGSGKSEMLQTLIAAMAIRYDPRIVNFVLVDYKGGPTVEPFRMLPHCVDIATNLQGNAVERIFTAINAEMNRRSDILAKAGVPDLVDYRKKVLPTRKADSPYPDTFPHLFVIVDEFAEMITQNPDYRAKFESITRLGRSFGVSLILATQRPTGVVSDQMRANMKFRLCLRVETPEDSKELLKKPDAAQLPQIGGRGYIQAGTDILTEVQVAWSGAPYAGDTAEDSPYKNDVVLAALGHPADAPRSVLGWLVGALAAEAKAQNIPKQFKPWPNPLLTTLPINTPVDASYINEVKGDEVVLSPSLKIWIDNPDLAAKKNPRDMGLWQSWGWEKPLPLRATMGVIDDPFSSSQRLLHVDMGGEPIVVFGSSGKGKTTFLKTLFFDLAAQRSPAELNIYALDFGRGGLRQVKQLPHCGATIDASQPDRVDALFRMLRGIMNERQDRLQKFASIEDYNLAHRDTPEQVFPAIVVAVDNMAEFKENFDGLMPELQALVRDGRQFGIYWILTASQQSDIPHKLYNLISRRYCFTMSEDGAYRDIVGRGALALANEPGRGLVNVEGQPLEYQVAVPVIAGEKDAYMRLGDRMDKAWAAMGGKRPSAEIPKAVTLLEMYQTILGKRVDRLGELGIAENWKLSMLPERQEWLSAPIGYVSSKEIRTMIFSAKAGGDGVHGMAAGTTGSGKSEMIQTLIAAMCIKYDPRIVNFVLVDYKGGPTIEPFRKLPHAVDLATNLDGNAVDRIFIAINAEMNRRSSILAKAGVADLVEYRKKVIPTLRPGSPFPTTFPHLFVIVDEFAEMMTQNPDYKVKFESITRLGRSFGVSLILATQRPSGAVTDQMKANMKFRICLRVETADDSKEMLGRPDGAMLPAIGGRGYVQVGGAAPTEVQVAWSGAPYDETKPDPMYPTDDILKAIQKEDDPPRSLLGWLVGALNLEAQRQEIPKQFKPWPNNLPSLLPINEPVDASYITKDPRNPTLVINPKVAEWVACPTPTPLWEPIDWNQPLSLEAAIGIVDNPYQAEQRVLSIDLASDPLVVMGAAGRGKSTFLKALITALAARYSPTDLHVFALDFARGGLKSLRTLPHMGGVVDSNEEERVERLFRMVRTTIDDRQIRLSAYDSLNDYNLKNPDNIMPIILVVVDNVSEFRETYDKYFPDLLQSVRDGRSFGIYFVVTGTLFADVPNKLFNLMGQRVTFTQGDVTDYTSIVGRGWVPIPDVPGRGLCVQMEGGKPFPMEFHTALPVGMGEGDPFRELCARFGAAWKILTDATPSLARKRAKAIEPLGRMIELASVLPEAGHGPPGLVAPIGINDGDREPTLVEFAAKGPHWIIVGPPATGKTTALRSLALSLAHSYSPSELGLVFFDPSDSARRFFAWGTGDDALDKLPHVLATVTNGKELDELILRLRAEYDEEVAAKLADMPDSYQPQDNTKRNIVVIMDHYDDNSSILRNSKLGGTGALAEIGKGKNLRFVIGGTLGIMRDSQDELRRRAEGSRYTLVLQDIETVRYMGIRMQFPTKELPAGRGFMIKAVSGQLVQVCLPAVDGKNGRSADDQVTDMIRAIRARYIERAQWSYFSKDIAPLDTLIRGDKAGAEGAAGGSVPESSNEPVAYSNSTASAMDEINKMLASQAALTAGLEVKLDTINLVSVEEPEIPAPDGAASAEAVKPAPAK